MDGVIIVVMQRLHEEDLTGQLLRSGGWKHLNLPAIATSNETIELGNGDRHFRKIGDILHPEREPKNVLDEIERNLGNMHFAAQYQQAPVPEAGNFIKRDWMRFYDTVPERNSETPVVQSWDTAMKDGEMNDYSVCTTWLKVGNDHYLIDLIRQRCDYHTLFQLVQQQYREHSAHAVLIEDKGFGTALIQDLRSHREFSAIPITPGSNKATRLSIAAVPMQVGRVSFPKEAPWLASFLDELLRFPQTRFDDQVDSFSQYFIWDGEKSRRVPFEATWMHDEAYIPDATAILDAIVEARR